MMQHYATIFSTEIILLKLLRLVGNLVNRRKLKIDLKIRFPLLGGFVCGLPLTSAVS